jgi:hypothetical protein
MTPDRCRADRRRRQAWSRALLEQLDPSLTGAGQRTARWNQLTRVDGTWRVDGYDLKPYEPRPAPAIS